jgi:hypothetical protein
MLKTHLILSLFLLLIIPVTLYSQAKSAFSGDPSKFRTELTTFMGPNLKPEQLTNLNTFLVRWDSAAFSNETMKKIIDVSSLLSARFMRPVPHFNDFLLTLNYSFEYKHDISFLKDWLKGVSRIAVNQKFTNENIDKFFKNSSSTIKDNVLCESGNVKWKVKNNALKFSLDTALYLTVSGATLTCYSQKDSTELYDVSGTYYPETQLFSGNKGIVTWEKAGYSRKDVFAELTDYSIDMIKSSFTVDSARLTHSTYFKEPVLGSLTDRAVNFSNKEKANYPRFETYKKEFRIKNMYTGVNYEGGLTFEGANVKGTGKNAIPAKIT